MLHAGALSTPGNGEILPLVRTRSITLLAGVRRGYELALYGPITGSSTTLALENSEVSPVALLVAVAVMILPSETFMKGAKLKVPVSDFTSPWRSVVTCFCPRKIWPSP